MKKPFLKVAIGFFFVALASFILQVFGSKMSFGTGTASWLFGVMMMMLSVHFGEMEE